MAKDCNNKKVKTIPKSISLHDNRCFNGPCFKCGELTIYCEHMSKYICCECCKNIK